MCCDSCSNSSKDECKKVRNLMPEGLFKGLSCTGLDKFIRGMLRIVDWLFLKNDARVSYAIGCFLLEKYKFPVKLLRKRKRYCSNLLQ